MPKTGLERAIDAAVEDFTEYIVDAVRDLPLEELSVIRGEDLVVRAEVSEPEPKVDTEEPPPAKEKTRLKCSYPGCTKNRFVRGHGYCGKHWRWWKKGKIPAEGPVEVAEPVSDAGSPEGTSPTELLTVREVSALLELPEHTIRRLHHQDILPSGFTLGPRRFRFVRGPVEEWAASDACKEIKRRRARRVWRASR
jgi:excisionase family DNA binding protein